MNTPAEITGFFHRQIPITAAMGVQVVAYSPGELILSAPLEPNHNHLQTAFGGSLNALATLAGYGFVWLALHDPAAHVVIRKSTISFRRPVTGELRAVCRNPGPEALRVFQEDFRAARKARLHLQVTIEDQGLLAVEFAGDFVATGAPANG